MYQPIQSHIYISIYMSIHLSIYLPIYLFIYLGAISSGSVDEDLIESDDRLDVTDERMDITDENDEAQDLSLKSRSSSTQDQVSYEDRRTDRWREGREPQTNGHKGRFTDSWTERQIQRQSDRQKD